MEQGKSFELEVKELLEQELRQNKLGLSPKDTKVYHRKAYYSQDRGGSIKTDVSLEVTRPGANDPFLIWVWECKDYTHSVPVDDIEEFHSKLEQVGVHRTRGTVACRYEFQTGAVNFAKSKAIGLARVLPDGSIIRLVEAVQTKEFVEVGLSEPDTQELGSMFYGLSSHGPGVTKFSDLFFLEMKDVTVDAGQQ